MIERILRGMAGGILIISFIMFHYHSTNWIWVMLFVALNLFQSGITNWCPAKSILEKVLNK